ncbi:beta-ketoacyl synthase [Bacterioplanoides sp. SCSIO 12839]|uniref:beta-ketoacyl synthase n=1 Tax=Bacterioplanoides sp. SCSIO 12839 TaxID=2829569 RepID=UPI002107219B|nr:beta-ketoacyl synthase [Bacterioplanoides sp. SCSIO 12839]UTW46952.1 beta-ketoacyl synthase [Bacterioplanoides sp. SCSIO 12839]
MSSQPSLALITGFGGINTAGRSSAHMAFQRVIFDVLNEQQQLETLTSLNQLMNLEGEPLDNQQTILQGSLIRGWDNVEWDAENIPFHQPFKNDAGEQCWRLTHKRLSVQSAGQTPKGFDPAAQYPSRHHPRGLQLTIYAASDAIASLGVEWDQLKQHVRPDQIGVYAGSAMGQLDPAGHGGMIQASLLGKRTSTKQCALGLSEMPADFVNAYVLGNVGATGSSVGACATFLYNLKTTLDDLRSGRRRIVVVGNAEAPLTPEIVEGYAAMTALINEQKLRDLDGKSVDEEPNYRQSSRPFGHNGGFTIAESAQFFVLTDEALALELGLTVHGSVGDVFVNADGFKKSISNPGIGNYLTMGKAVAEARRWFGSQTIQHGSFIHAHGSSTPQNRVTESHIYAELAKAFGIDDWKITAVKAHLGHPLSVASADQLLMTLGTWAHNIIPGITTTDRIAEDVHQYGLNFLLQHTPIENNEADIAFINSKGFGGNNASAFIVSPHKTHELMQKNCDAACWNHYLDRNEKVQEKSWQYNEDMSAGKVKPVYQFGEQVLDADDLTINDEEIYIRGWQQSVKL